MDPESKNDTNGSPRGDKSKIIRNREVDKAAKALAEEHVLPQPPGTKLSWSQMQEYLSLLTPDMWSHLSLYVYRLKPKIRRQLKNPELPNYIDCFGEPVSLEYFTGRHGGGKYMIQATDSDRKRSKDESQELFQCFLEIDDVKYPPILDYEELVIEARENQSYVTWLRNQGILDAKGNVVQDRNSTPAAAANGALSAKDILEILKYVNTMNVEQQNQLKEKLAPGGDSISKSVGDILLEKMKQDDPAKQVQMWSGLVAGLKDIIGTSKSDNGISQVYDRLIAMQAKSNETVMSLIDRLLQHQQQQQPRTALDEFDKVFSLLDRAKQWGGSGGRRTGWDIGYDIARDIGLPVFQTFGTVLTNIMALRRGQAPPVAAAGAAAAPVPIQAPFDPYRNPAAAAAYAASLRNDTPAASGTPPGGTPPPPRAPEPQPPAAAAPGTNDGSNTASNAQAIEIFQQYGNLVLNALNNGTHGWEFADNLVGLLGNSTHAMVANHGEDALVTTMLSIPEFAVFGEQRLRAFVYEFIHFEDQDFGEDSQEEPDQIDVSKVYQPRPRQAAQPARR